MAKFIYLGPAVETTAFGVTFPKGEAVEVVVDHAVSKLTNNPCFIMAGGEPKKPTVAELLPVIAAATPEELNALSEGETRKMVTDAISKRMIELQSAE